MADFVVDDELGLWDPIQQHLLVIADEGVATPGEQQRRDVDVLQCFRSFGLQQPQEDLSPYLGGYRQTLIDETCDQLLGHSIRRRPPHELLDEARVDRIGQRHDPLAYVADAGLVGERDRAADEDQAGYPIRVTYCHDLGNQAATRSADEHGGRGPAGVHEVDDV